MAFGLWMSNSWLSKLTVCRNLMGCASFDWKLSLRDSAVGRRTIFSIVKVCPRLTRLGFKGLFMLTRMALGWKCIQETSSKKYLRRLSQVLLKPCIKPSRIFEILDGWSLYVLRQASRCFYPLPIAVSRE